MHRLWRDYFRHTIMGEVGLRHGSFGTHGRALGGRWSGGRDTSRASVDAPNLPSRADEDGAAEWTRWGLGKWRRLRRGGRDHDGKLGGALAEGTLDLCAAGGLRSGVVGEMRCRCSNCCSDVVRSLSASSTRCLHHHHHCCILLPNTPGCNLSSTRSLPSPPSSISVRRAVLSRSQLALNRRLHVVP